MRAALICHDPRLGQVALGSLHANGIRPWLIYDNTTAMSLRASFLHRGVLFAAPELSAYASEIVTALNGLHAGEGLDMVLGADVESLFLLAHIRDQLTAPVFPMPESTTLALLNDKWRFHNLCQDLDVALPKTLCYPSATSVDVEEVERELGFPAVIKPSASSGGRGFLKVASAAELESIVRSKDYDFDGVLAQEFIEGQDVGLSVFAREGVVTAAATFLCGPRSATEFVDLPELLTIGRAIVAATGYTGVANFDGRIDPDGVLRLFECNPRFFIRLNATRLCGVDFLAAGLSAGTGVTPVAAGSYYAPGQVLRPAGLKRLLDGRWDRHVLLRSWSELLRDPAPTLLRKLGIDAGWKTPKGVA